MPAIELEASYGLLSEVIETLYSRRHSPVPGALAKAQMSGEVTSRGLTFNERDLGFSSFLEYVKSAPGIAIQIRPGSDMLLAPSSATDTLSAYASPLPIIRRDLWRAFLSFPIKSTVRIYDPDEDKVFYDSAPTSRKGLEIEPISKEEHLAWRQDFSAEQPEPARTELLAALGQGGASVFTEFARRLRENPAIMRAWNRFLQKKVGDRVAAWGQKHGITEDRWRGGISSRSSLGSLDNLPGGTQNLGQRAELYNFLDNLPIEDLLQLRVPLDWVLKVVRNNK